MLADKNFDIRAGGIRVFPSDIPIKGSIFCRVFIDKVGEGDWSIVEESTYQLINDTVTFSTAPVGYYLVLQVATTPSELTQSPSENVIILTIKDDIVKVAQMGEAVSEVAQNAYKWANNPENAVVKNGEYSAYHWARKAQQIANSSATAITFNKTGTNLTATNVQDAIVAINNKADNATVNSLQATKVTTTTVTGVTGSNVQDNIASLQANITNKTVAVVKGWNGDNLAGKAVTATTANSPTHPFILTATGTPTGTTYYVQTIWADNNIASSNCVQIAYRRSSPNELWTRTRYGGTWTAWSKPAEDKVASQTVLGSIKAWVASGNLYLATF